MGESDTGSTPPAARASRVGLYAWGGPGSIDLLRVKYHSPRINERSFLGLYSYASLRRAREVLGATDLWMTYSWGFSDKTEEAHRRFARKHIAGARALGYTTYGYVQGLNVVTREFKGRDIFCKSVFGFKQPYSRGRHFICPNNPEARALILSRVAATAREDFDNVFMDNVLFGLPPFHVSTQYVASFGCHCAHCRRAFRDMFGYELPATTRPSKSSFEDLLAFRVASTRSLIRDSSAIARAAGKGFGINLYDPSINAAELFFGYALEQIAEYLDYYLIENHAIALDGQSIDNTYLTSLIRDSEKPVFVVSYRHGIGVDAAYEPHSIDLIYAESRALGYHPCIKASEFVTNGVWHALDTTRMTRPYAVSVAPAVSASTPLLPISSRPVVSWAARLFDPFMPVVFEVAFRNRTIFSVLKRTRIYTKLLRRQRRFALPRPRQGTHHVAIQP